MSIRIGKLRHRVTIQQRQAKRTPMGQQVYDWSAFDDVWADVQPVTGAEKDLGDLRVANMTHTVRIRARDDITPQMRILFGSRVLEINAIANLAERGHEMRLVCTERVEQAAEADTTNTNDEAPPL